VPHPYPGSPCDTPCYSDHTGLLSYHPGSPFDTPLHTPSHHLPSFTPAALLHTGRHPLSFHRYESQSGDVDECAGIEPFPWHISFCGDVDNAGHLKPQASGFPSTSYLANYLPNRPPTSYLPSPLLKASGSSSTSSLRLSASSSYRPTFPFLPSYFLPPPPPHRPTTAASQPPSHFLRPPLPHRPTTAASCGAWT
jgi:hypothetical protein